jgi:hypothetical protein
MRFSLVAALALSGSVSAVFQPSDLYTSITGLTAKIQALTQIARQINRYDSRDINTGPFKVSV